MDVRREVVPKDLVRVQCHCNFGESVLFLLRRVICQEGGLGRGGFLRLCGCERSLRCCAVVCGFAPLLIGRVQGLRSPTGAKDCFAKKRFAVKLAAGYRDGY